MDAEFAAMDSGTAVASPEMIAKAYAPVTGGQGDVQFTIGRPR